MLGIISISSIYWSLICDPRHDLSWKIYHVHLKRKCIPLLSGGMSYKNRFSLSGLMCHLSLHPSSIMCSVMSDTFQTQVLLSLENFPGKNIGVGCHSFSKLSSQRMGRNCISWVFCIGRWILYHLTTWESLFKSCVSLLIFSLDDLSIGLNGVLKSPTILCYCQISLLWLLEFALFIKLLISCMQKYSQLLYLFPGLTSWLLHSVLPYIL